MNTHITLLFVMFTSFFYYFIDRMCFRIFFPFYSISSFVLCSFAFISLFFSAILNCFGLSGVPVCLCMGLFFRYIVCMLQMSTFFFPLFVRFRTKNWKRIKSKAKNIYIRVIATQHRELGPHEEQKNIFQPKYSYNKFKQLNIAVRKYFLRCLNDLKKKKIVFSRLFFWFLTHFPQTIMPFHERQFQLWIFGFWMHWISVSSPWLHIIHLLYAKANAFKSLSVKTYENTFDAYCMPRPTDSTLILDIAKNFWILLKFFGSGVKLETNLDSNMGTEH